MQAQSGSDLPCVALDKDREAVTTDSSPHPSQLTDPALRASIKTMSGRSWTQEEIQKFFVSETNTA